MPKQAAVALVARDQPLTPERVASQFAERPPGSAAADRSDVDDGQPLVLDVDREVTTTRPVTRPATASDGRRGSRLAVLGGVSTVCSHTKRTVNGQVAWWFSRHCAKISQPDSGAVRGMQYNFLMSHTTFSGVGGG